MAALLRGREKVTCNDGITQNKLLLSFSHAVIHCIHKAKSAFFRGMNEEVETATDGAK